MNSELDNLTPEQLHTKKKAEFAACKTVDELNNAMHKYRSYDMLTVKDLIEYLKTQNPDACVVGYEQNSCAYIEQMKDLPNQYICTVEEMKKLDRVHYESWYKDSSPEDRAKKVEEHIAEIYRYTEDDDVILNI